MSPDAFLQFLNSLNVFPLFFKVFAGVFSFLFIIYSLVIYKQTQVMIKTVISKNDRLIILISLTQIGAGLILLFFALFLI